jgi:dihydroorotate dehydrogenase (NAD+) catalytic subunit
MLDPATLEPILATATGGLSGPALRPVALAAVYACAQATSLPIVGMGGVETGEHALALIAAGASDVALGTVLFGDPAAPHRIRTELEEAAQRRGVASAAGVFRMAHRDQSNASEVSSKTCDRGESLPELTKIAVGS